MKSVRIIETNDGNIFNTERDAADYLENNAYLIAGSLAAKIINMPALKYVDLIEFIISHADDFKQIYDLVHELKEGVITAED